jgi:glycerol-3-phosphate cytidylyltransferase
MKVKNGQHLKVGFTCSTFDLLHAGHILMLEEAKAQCDYLICGLQTDPTIDRPGVKNKPIQSVVERYVQLNAVKYVDEIVIYSTEQDLIDLIQILPLDVRILGEEYKDKPFTGKKECEDLAIAFHFNSRTHRFSSTELRNRMLYAELSKKQPSTLITASAWTEP